MFANFLLSDSSDDIYSESSGDPNRLGKQFPFCMFIGRRTFAGNKDWGEEGMTYICCLWNLILCCLI